ncbi:MAG: SDR family oxidoreductase [Novosphingobium sp.]|nr:SDR family oxidoreductase [Novosphingobium sp.]
MQLEGKTALITGGGGGIGAGIAEALVERGTKVAITDINLDFATAEAERIGGGAVAMQHDVTSLDSWADVVAQVGQIDVLCNNAGISQQFKPLVDVAPDEFARLLAINVTGVYNGIHTCVPPMIARGEGHVVNTSSLNGLLPHGPFAGYCATKFAVAGMSEALRIELEPKGIGVSILYPGLTRSRMSESQGGEMDPETAKILASRMMEPVWLGRAVADAIEQNCLHIITHPVHKPTLEARFTGILEAHGDPAQPDYEGGAFSTD